MVRRVNLSLHLSTALATAAAIPVSSNTSDITSLSFSYAHDMP